MPAKISKTEPRGAFVQSFKTGPLSQVRLLYTTFIQGLFSASPPGCYHWTPELEDTEIVITQESPINLEVANDRPCITFTRAPVSFFQLGFDDMLEFDQSTGRKTKSLLIPGTMLINVCSRNDLESEHLAWVVAEHLWLLRDLLMKQGFYDVGRNLQVGSPTPAGGLISGDSGDEWFCTTIASPYHFYRTSSFSPLNQRFLKEIDVRLNALRQIPLTPGVPLQLGANPPYNVENQFPPNVLPQPQPSPHLVPHPLNPAQMVTIRGVRSDAPGLTPLRIRGRHLPIQPPRVGQSTPSVPLTLTVKV